MGWFYYDHEAMRWNFAKIKLAPDGKRASICSDFREVARFDIPTESFTLLRWNRTLRPAQEWMPEKWKPEDELKFKTQPHSPMEVGAPNNLPPPGYQWK
ncbi:MAG: hypothetical protein M3Y82_11650 [Verrucomicrobiota bacterium]|nr:hypothetical protein [Verrucomicrobiota bacterium]